MITTSTLWWAPYPNCHLLANFVIRNQRISTFEICLVWTDGFSCNSWWGIFWILAGTSRHSWWGTRYDFIFITINIFEVFFLPGSILKHTKAYISSTNLTSSLCSSSNVSSDSSYTTTSSPPLLPSGFDLSLTSTVNHPWTSQSQFRPWNNIFFLLYRNYLRPNSDAYFAFKTTSYKAGAKMRLRASQQNFLRTSLLDSYLWVSKVEVDGQYLPSLTFSSNQDNSEGGGR